MSDTITPEERAQWRANCEQKFPVDIARFGRPDPDDVRILRLLSALEAAEAARKKDIAHCKFEFDRAEQAEAENARLNVVANALARKLAQATRGWAKAGYVDNSATYWLSWAKHDAEAEIKAARRAVAGEGE